MKNISAEDQHQIILSYTSGELSVRELAIKYSVNYHVIRNLLIKNNIPRDRASILFSKKRTGAPSHRKGVVLSQSTRQKISENNKGKQTSLGKKFSQKTRSLMSIKRKQFLANNPDHMKSIQEIRLSKIDKEKSRTSAKIRGIQKRFLRRTLTLTKYTKKGRTHEELGYTHLELKEYLEKQFVSGMNWTDRHSFQIDHIVPVSIFIKNNITDPAIINALCNLRPLTAIENQLKSDKYNEDNFSKDLQYICEFIAKRKAA